MKRAMALILAGGQGERLSILSAERAKPAVPFAGKYRIIDFVLSNCTNSGLTNVAVLTQYRPRSLNDHIGIGRPWDLDRQTAGLRLLQPYLGGGREWYKGTADAVYQNLYVVEESNASFVLVLGGDHIYKMDYTAMLSFHERKGADVTMAVREVPIEEAHRFGIVATNEDGEVVDFIEKPARPPSNLVSMGIYIFSRNILFERLQEDALSTTSQHDFGKDVLPSMVGRDRVYAFRHEGYWQDVGTVQSLWDANMDMLEEPAPLDLYDAWTIHTKSEERAPAKIVSPGRVVNSLVSHGCVVEGTVEHSVLSPGVRVAPGAVVRDSIIMGDAVIGRNAFLHKVIVDKEGVVGANAIVGHGPADVPNRSEPGRLNTGITLIGKRAHVPANCRIGRNVLLMPGLRDSDYPGLDVESGSTIRVLARQAALAV